MTLRVLAVCGLATSLVTLSAACQSENPEPSKVCTPGASVACTGADGCSGSKACTADGTAYSGCDCGVDGGIGDDAGVDAGEPSDAGADAGDFGAPCNPLTNTGCSPASRCDWIKGDGGGRFGCAPPGTATRLEACAYDPTGVDDCAAGFVCVSGECRQPCAPAGETTQCGADFSCIPNAELSDPAGTMILGACEPTCDPLTQARTFDGAAACGSPDPAAPTRGCFGVPDQAFTCWPVAFPDRVHRDRAGGNGTSTYVNGCAPGFLPLLQESSGSDTIVCIALCRPAESYQGHTSELNGVSPDSCLERGASGANEECRFWSSFETIPTASPGNTLGYCLDPTKYTWDDDQNPQTPAAPFPSCATLPNTDTDGDGVPQHVSFGCGPAKIP